MEYTTSLKPWHSISSRGNFYEKTMAEENAIRENIFYEREMDEDQSHGDFYTPRNHHRIYGSKIFDTLRSTETQTDLQLPIIISGFPEYTHSDLDLPIVIDISANIVSTRFIKTLKDVGFHDFATYPVRVYEIELFKDREATEEEHVKAGRPYYDDLYVLIQLTIPFFEPVLALQDGEKSPEGAVDWGEDKYLPANWATRDYPGLFRIREKFPWLYCNTKVAKALASACPSLTFSPSVDGS
jgi:hypothetical protein